MISWVVENFGDQVLPALVDHVTISASAILIALAISGPLGIYITRHGKLYGPVLLVSGVLYSIPSLALFALLISVPGMGLGARPAVVALVLYSLLMLVRNTVEGIRSVPPSVREAAVGMGLTPRQILWQVELPLALPIITAGVRVSAVTVIGTATIAAYIGGGGLGRIIFDGISSDFTTKIVVGAFFATLLSLAVDLALLLLEKRLRPWAV